MPNPDRDIVEVMSSLLDSATARVEGLVVVKIQSFDRATQTAEVSPQVLKNGEQQPNVQSVPVLFPVAYQDIQVNQDPLYGVMLVGGINWRRWWRTGEVSVPEDATSHGLTNGILLPGLTTQGGPRDLFTNSTVLVRPGGGGTVRLGTYDAAKKVVHEDLPADINSLCVALNTWGALIETATGTPWAPVKIYTDRIIAAQLGAGYVSPSVRVED